MSVPKAAAMSAAAKAEAMPKTARVEAMMKPARVEASTGMQAMIETKMPELVDVVVKGRHTRKSVPTEAAVIVRFGKA